MTTMTINRDKLDNGPQLQGVVAIPARCVDDTEIREERRFPRDMSLNELYEEYLEHSLRYYEYDCAVISDEDYDHLCSILHQHWPDVTHRLKYITHRSDLAKRSGINVQYRGELGWLRSLIDISIHTALSDTKK